ncbi:MAG: glycosyltransferase family 39 protein [Planctomycetota bacterium]
MSPLLIWGLPDRTHDKLLFGGQPAWNAERFQVAAALQERRQRAAGADTDLNPLAVHERIVKLTSDESARAEILRRYRLFSRQPDEMITLMALQRMQPRELDFDPRLYQYGGGYIYLVAGAIAVAALPGYTNLTADASLYLEQPELFARFYLVARFIVLIFGALTLVAVWKLTRRAAGRGGAWLAFLFVACTPVFISGVLEAKPHVPAACLVLWAILSALNYHSHGRLRDVVMLGLQTGYATSLVLTGVVAMAILPVLLVFRRQNEPPHCRVKHLLLAGALAVGVYLATNPYVPYNFFFHRAALTSNVDNSTAMYANQMRQVTAGAQRVGQLLWESCGPGLLLVGLLGLAWLLRRRPGPTSIATASGLAMLVIAILLGAGKPAEYARFLVLPVILLCAAAASLLAVLSYRRLRWLAVLLAIACIAPMKSATYLRAFAIDAAGADESRHLAAQYIEQHARPIESIAVLQEPAPYAVPPLDFAHRDLYLLPLVYHTDLRASELPPWLVCTADDQMVHRKAWWQRHYYLVRTFPPAGAQLSRITWANKPVYIYRRQNLPIE